MVDQLGGEHMTKISVPIADDEFVALSSLANREMRHPREQARYILRSVLLSDQPTVEDNKPAAATLPERTANGFVNSHS